MLLSQHVTDQAKDGETRRESDVNSVRYPSPFPNPPPSSLDDGSEMKLPPPGREILKQNTATPVVYNQARLSFVGVNPYYFK